MLLRAVESVIAALDANTQPTTLELGIQTAMKQADAMADEHDEDTDWNTARNDVYYAVDNLGAQFETSGEPDFEWALGNLNTALEGLSK